MMYRSILASFLWVMVSVSGACINAGSEFRCGERMAGNGAIRVCDGLHEVCVCSTRSCAVRLDSTDKQCNEEGGGYKYLSVPFVYAVDAGSCVDKAHEGSIITASATDTPLCEPETDAAATDAPAIDAPVDAPAIDAPVDAPAIDAPVDASVDAAADDAMAAQ